jgi:hypothetical protein
MARDYQGVFIQGWVERSEIHHPVHVTMGFAALYPSYETFYPFVEPPSGTASTARLTSRSVCAFSIELHC